MSRFIINDDNTVTDTKLGLIWTRETIAKDVNHEAAQKAVAALGEGWRLPTRRELESIQDLTRHDPCIDTEKFPGTESCAYWSSTPCAWNTAAVWVVGFGFGHSVDGHRGGDACVRAVRAVPAVAGVPEGMVLVQASKLQHAHMHAKTAVDCIVGFSKDKPGGMCGWLDDACTSAEIAEADLRAMLAAAPAAPSAQEGKVPEEIRQIADAAAAFFGWYNRHYPTAPSEHPDHPWVRLGMALTDYMDFAPAPVATTPSEIVAAWPEWKRNYRLTDHATVATEAVAQASLRVDLELDDGTKCDITCHGTERDMTRLAARLRHLRALEEQAVAHPKSCVCTLCKFPPEQKAVAQGGGVEVERSAFEAHMQNEFGYVDLSRDYTCDEDGTYNDRNVSNAWYGWRERALLSASPAVSAPAVDYIGHSLPMGDAMAIALEAGIESAPISCTWTRIFDLIDAAYNHGRRRPAPAVSAERVAELERIEDAARSAHALFSAGGNDEQAIRILGRAIAKQSEGE